MASAGTRKQIVEAADRLFYEQGFETTSLADIAAIVGLSRGNFYYHFKTKDEILSAVIDRRLAATQAMLEAFEANAPTPKARIMRFVRILLANRTAIMAHGCPVGTLSNELAKLDHAAHGRAVEIFGLFRAYLSRQFAALGRADADALALHVLMRSQGVAALATAFRDSAFVDREIDDLAVWLDAACPEPKDSTAKAH